MKAAEREHFTDGRDCWCDPDWCQPCPVCDAWPKPDGCLRCGGTGLVDEYDPDATIIIVHRYPDGDK
jgi:hypothetical protein